MRRRMMRRAAALFLLVLVFFVLASAVAGSLLFHAGQRPFGGLLVVVLLILVIATVRGARRYAAPVAEVMEAADRVAGGDLAVRVQERGPRDVRRLGRAFNEMAERLETSETRRRAMLADVTHELRTPLAVIQGNLEGLADGIYPTDAAHLAPVIEETRVMGRLLDDLQTLSTAEAGALRLFREPVAPARLVDDAIAAFGSAAADRSISLEGRVAAGLPELSVDRVRVGEVLANLLTNAVRHTPRGGSIVLSAEATDRAVAFVVSDTGPGIAPDDLPFVFDRFAKSADSHGSGLGLAIARRLVEAHGGTIGVEATSASGTRIRVTLPVG